VSVVYDSTDDYLIVFGGFQENGAQLNDTWELQLGGDPTWQMVTPTGELPAPRSETESIWNPHNGRLVVYGGFGDAGPLSDVWQFVPTGVPSWTLLSPSGPTPTARYWAGVDYDSHRACLTFFGGADSDGYDQNETWCLSLDGPLVWSKIVPVGAVPGALVSCTAS
jgi:hypothetical protein